MNSPNTGIWNTISLLHLNKLFEMKRISLIIFLLWSAPAFSQDTFLETFNLQNNGQAFFMKQTEDGGFFLIGNDLFPASYFYTKTDSLGNIEFSKVIAASESCRINDMITINGTNILLGYDNDGIFFMTKIDFDGNPQSIKSLTSSQGADLRFIDKTDSTILWTANFSLPLYNNIIIAKTDTAGTFLSGQILTNTNYLGTYDFVSLGNDGFYLLGSIYDNTLFISFTSVVKCDMSGNIIWSKQYDLISQGKISADKTIHNGMIISSDIRDSITNKTVLLKIDSIGNIEWNKVYSTPLPGNITQTKVVSVPESGYAVSGCIDESFGKYAFLFKTDLSGNIQWANKYEGSYEYVHSICVTSDSGFALSGSTNGFGGSSTGTTSFLGKTDSLGQLGCFDLTLVIDTNSIQINSTNISFTSSPYTLIGTVRTFPSTTDDTGVFLCSSTLITSEIEKPFSTIYPNPIHDNATLVLSQNESYTFIAYDVFGKSTFEKKINSIKSELDFSQLPNGIYFYQISNSENNFTGKFIVAH